jgi:protein gp37
LINWIVMGGESGPNARPMHPNWVRQTRDACVEAGVPFFFKQGGEYGTDPYKIVYNNHVIWIVPDGRYEMAGGGDLWDENKAAVMGRVGKKAAGHIIDGREWRQLPEVGA